MSTSDPHKPLEIDRRNARTTALGLGIWLALTVAVVVLLLLFGTVLTGIFV
ncbi:hypothetical protein SAMN04487967_2446 [Natronorubrum sediminis]|uniref:Uncharacterized protein n=1 Tax=Natronorubrum sediminis TaxID=640943 RepID=A0A1H6G1H2_9EURY|nr:hypothetical protein [Natronorubrum sediminis]SEH16123.1 hypothetical protein SAMN04487967_2446 [Natronorubrum sediminis]